MSDFTSLLQQGNAWFFIPSAILLGALHGLEPGHSKTMMAAFIVAIKGTVKQAVMLGLAATISHTAVVWGIALGGMFISSRFTAEAVEPWFQLISGAIILCTAAWMFWRTWRGERGVLADLHGHDRDDGGRTVDTGHGLVTLTIDEPGDDAFWRLNTVSGHPWQAGEVTVTTLWDGGESQTFRFRSSEGALTSIEPIPEPHAFSVRLTLSHDGHGHEYDLSFDEDHHHHHHDHHPDGPDAASDGAYQDAHERAHADDIRRRFSNREATNGQILLFGLTGGLIPCPAAITVLLICIQMKAITLGATLVLCFSIGLALTLVAVGVAAAFSVRQAGKRWPGFNTLARRAPYFSSGLIALVGLYMGWHGWSALV